jgi:hypothetical protein
MFELHCKRCGGTGWRVTAATTKHIDFGTSEMSGGSVSTQLECASCGHKATLAEMASIRATRLFRDAVESLRGTDDNTASLSQRPAIG